MRPVLIGAGVIAIGIVAIAAGSIVVQRAGSRHPIKSVLLTDHQVSLAALGATEGVTMLACKGESVASEADPVCK